MTGELLKDQRDRRAYLSYGAELVAYGGAAAALLVLLTAWSDRITENNGYGYDGKFYVQMMQQGMEGGSPSTRLRPVVVFINRLVNDHLIHDPITTFRSMNLLYACVLAMLLADLCRRYGATRAATVTLVLNVGVCIATAKMFAFYPTLVDLGAYALITAGAWAIVTGRRLLIVPACVLAVLSREFAVVLVLFGVWRDLRERRSWLIVVASYAPAIAAIAWIRQLASSYPDDTSAVWVLSFGTLVRGLFNNLSWWADPLYGAFWLYFLATTFGGLSLWLLTRRAPWSVCLRTEPEWLALVVPVVAVSAFGSLDIWRYTVYALPALPAFWAWSLSGMPRNQMNRALAGISVATLVTQRPWQRMDLESYFRDWFPYYLVVEDPLTAGKELFPVWTYRLVIVVVLIAALAVLGRSGSARPSMRRLVADS